MELVILGGTSFLLQLGNHFLPWGPMAGKKELPRLAAYIIGTGLNLIIASCWAVLHGGSISILALYILTVCAGLGVLTGYGIDWWIELARRVPELTAESALLKDQRDGRED